MGRFLGVSMDLGVRVKEGGQDFRTTLSQAEIAEEAGFHTLYIAEHHGFRSAPYWPSPFLCLAAIASRTDSINLGTNISILPLSHPAKMAENISMLDVISGGRTVFGFGIGWREEEYETFGVPFSARGKLMTESLRFLREALNHGTASMHTSHFRIEDFELIPAPLQSNGPDILIGGWSDNAMKRALNLSDGWVSPGGKLHQNKKFINSFKEKGGRKVILGTDGVVIREKKEKALADTRRFLKCVHRPLVRENRFPQEDGFEGHSNSSTAAEDKERYLQKFVDFKLRNGLNSLTSNDLFIAGSPSDAIEQIERIHNSTDCDEIILRLHAYGLADDQSHQTLKLLKKEVLPSFT